MNRRRFTIQYLLSDVLGSGIAWTIFFIFRKLVVEPAKYGYKVPIKFDENFYWALLIIPAYWIFIYWLNGAYKNIYRKSRLKEFASGFIITFVGTLIIFFILLLDDEVRNYKVYRITFSSLFVLQFFIVTVSRMTILTVIKNKIRKRIISFNTLIVGSNENALKLYHELEGERYSQGYNFKGYVSVIDSPEPSLDAHLIHLGNYKEINRIIRENQIEIVIVAIQSSEHEQLHKVISLLKEEQVNIKIIPDNYDLISGSVKMNYIFGTALMDISPEIMPPWQKNIKRLLDVVFSTLVMILFSPAMLAIAIAIKMDSKGPVLFWQERIGKNMKPFQMVKFRTMIDLAEKNGPELSHSHDPRITKVGHYLRKYRLDEVPQFYNVLKGEMSIIGPRPERKFYIDQIVEQAPQYRYLLKSRPGITSWGQIKYGYAENVEQMVERMKFDILYVENMSLGMDFKIVFYTILIIIKGTGK
ncbi:MAG: sugar transferase [Bacteroidetes bacterium]|nr:sugar transferase [Bacteroidota bacterium]